MRASAGILAALALWLPATVSAQYWYPQNHSYSPWWSGTPSSSWCRGSSCIIGTQRVFAPSTSITVNPHISGVASAAASQYSYPQNQGSYGYSYPQYSYSDPYYYSYQYQPSSYPSSYSYSYPSYTSYYTSDEGYCYGNGYGCYPFYVEDPQQWIYDRWTGSWY